MPIDINLLRSYKAGGDPNKWKVYMTQRFKDATIVDQVVALDEQWRSARATIDDLRKESNTLQRTVIGPKKKSGEDCATEIETYKEMMANIKQQEENLPAVAIARDTLLNQIGNLVDPEVPISQNEEQDNLVTQLHPLPASVTLPCRLADLSYDRPARQPLTHDDLLWRIGGYEPTRGQYVAGHRGYFLTNAGVLLNQALINYGIAFLRARGYDILQPPFLMNKHVMATIAQLGDFDEQLYKVSGKTDATEEGGATDEKYLIATSEQPICAYHANEWLDPKKLPFRYCGISTCFRKEAGSHGKDIRGIFRVHQFEKIEQFCVTTDDFTISSAEQKHMLQCAADFWQSLGIAYRVVCLVSGELNDAAVKKYDLEGWFPGQNEYRELVSCSNCTDYQARGVNVRCGQKTTKDASPSYCHMLNATLCATGRGICVVLETYQKENGVVVPDVLRPYMGGMDFLPFVRDAPELSKGEKAGPNAGKAAK